MESVWRPGWQRVWAPVQPCGSACNDSAEEWRRGNHCFRLISANTKAVGEETIITANGAEFIQNVSVNQNTRHAVQHRITDPKLKVPNLPNATWFLFLTACFQGFLKRLHEGLYLRYFTTGSLNCFTQTIDQRRSNQQSVWLQLRDF